MYWLKVLNLFLDKNLFKIAKNMFHTGYLVWSFTQTLALPVCCSVEETF